MQLAYLGCMPGASGMQRGYGMHSSEPCLPEGNVGFKFQISSSLEEEREENSRNVEHSKLSPT